MRFPLHGPFHITLTNAQPYIPDQQILKCDGIKTRDDLKIPGGSVRLSCRDFDHPTAIGMCGSPAFKTVKLQLNGGACRGRAKYPDGPVALQDHVIGKGRIQPKLGPSIDNKQHPQQHQGASESKVSEGFFHPTIIF